MLAAHGVTHPARRQTNEDAMLVDPALGLFIVADGMGGHNAGEVASAIAVRTIHGAIASGVEASERSLAEAVRLANRKVLSAAAAQPDYDGMGTTVVVAHVNEDRLVFGSVGDSRLYVWRDGLLNQLTRDDSWLSRVVPDAAATPEEAQRHPMRHVLTQVVGLRMDIEPAVGDWRVEQGDIILLCSDGLHGTVADDRIAESVRRSGSVEEIARRLVDQALVSGGSDNVTVVVIRRE